LINFFISFVGRFFLGFLFYRAALDGKLEAQSVNRLSISNMDIRHPLDNLDMDGYFLTDQMTD